MRINALTLAGLVSLAFIAGSLSQAFPSLEDRIEASLEPCLDNFLEARFQAAIGSWDAIALEQGVKLGDTIPVGHHAGDYIPTSCFVVEGLGGHITYFQRPFKNGELDMTVPAFIEDSWMHHSRLAQKG